MIIKRKIESELLRWKNSKNRKPVILRGARQVGKTFVVNQFAGNFDHFIDINLERPREREFFSGFNTGRELVERILLYKGRRVDAKRTLLFIDEIQHSAEAIRALRYLHEDVKELCGCTVANTTATFQNRHSNRTRPYTKQRHPSGPTHTENMTFHKQNTIKMHKLSQTGTYKQTLQK